MRVDFYSLSQNKTLEQVVLHLVNKASEQSWRIGIFTKDKKQTDELQTALWSLSPNSFFAHEVISSSRCESSQAAIMLFTQEPDDIATLDYFINISNVMPKYNSENGRLAEVIAADEESLKLGRERYTQFKSLTESNAITLNHHKI